MSRLLTLFPSPRVSVWWRISCRTSSCFQLFAYASSIQSVFPECKSSGTLSQTKEKRRDVSLGCFELDETATCIEQTLNVFIIDLFPLRLKVWSSSSISSRACPSRLEISFRRNRMNWRISELTIIKIKLCPLEGLKNTLHRSLYEPILDTVRTGSAWVSSFEAEQDAPDRYLQSSTSKPPRASEQASD